MEITTNFKKEEFNCKCGCKMPEEVLSNVKLLAVQLQEIRDCLNARIMINSAYRCVDHNRSIGSNDSSQHILGKAADIVVGGKKPDEVVESVELMIEEETISIRGLGRYDTFTHVDIRDNYARWDNRSK